MSQADLDEVRAYVELIRWAKQEEAKLKDLKEEARIHLEEAMGYADEGVLDGEVVITWRSHKRTALDIKAVKASYPLVYEECLKTSSVRRFEVVSDD